MSASPLVSISDDKRLFSVGVSTIYLSIPLTFIPLLFITAPYGKHSRSGWGLPIPAPIAWFMMESPTLCLSLLLLPFGRNRSHPIALSILSLFLLHYINRSIIYPLRLHRSRIPTSSVPLSIAFMAFVFNLLNAYIQTRSATHYADYKMFGIGMAVRVAVGVGMFVWGMAVNVGADLALLRLKTEGGGGYRIPRGGWFEVVSCPNYMGEMAEWLGWALIAWSPAAFGFFLYTVANLLPRARSHHRWYLHKFGEDYPTSRKAVLPLIF